MVRWRYRDRLDPAADAARPARAGASEGEAGQIRSRDCWALLGLSVGCGISIALLAHLLLPGMFGPPGSAGARPLAEWARLPRPAAAIAPAAAGPEDDQRMRFERMPPTARRQVTPGGRSAHLHVLPLRTLPADAHDGVPALRGQLLRDAYAAHRAGHPATAAYLLEVVLLEHPGDSAALDALTILPLEDPAVASSVLRQATAYPDHLVLQRRSARVALARGDEAGAAVWVNRALAIASDDRDSLVLKAEILDRMGDADAALATYRRFLRVQRAAEYVPALAKLPVKPAAPVARLQVAVEADASPAAVPAGGALARGIATMLPGGIGARPAAEDLPRDR